MPRQRFILTVTISQPLARWRRSERMYECSASTGPRLPHMPRAQAASAGGSAGESENDLAARMQADAAGESSFLRDLIRPTLLTWVNYDVAHHVVPLQHALGLRVVGGDEGEVKELWRDPSQPVVKRILFFLMSIYFDVSVQTTCRG